MSERERSRVMQTTICGIAADLQDARAVLDDDRYQGLVDIIDRHLHNELGRLALGEALRITRGDEHGRRTN